MLLPRLNCFMCVSGSASTSPGRPTGPGADVPPDAVENWSRVPSRTVPARAPRVRRAPAWRLADRSGSGYWVCASRGLCVQRRSRPAGIRVSYLRPPYSYAIVTGFISPFVGPAYSYLHTSLLTYPLVAVTVADASVSASGAPAHPLVAVRRTPRYQRVRTSVAMSTGCVAMVGWR